MSAQPATRPDPRRILLVRHGQAYNSIEPDGRREVVDRSNPPLTPTGEQQAGELAQLLADFAPDRVLCSPFLRVAQTLHLALEEVRTLLDAIRGALSEPASSRQLLERAAQALLDYIESTPDGFRIVCRDSTLGSTEGTYASILSDIASQVEDILAAAFRTSKLSPSAAPMYAQMLVGMIALTGQWWLDAPVRRRPSTQEVAAHLVNLSWNGLRNLEKSPTLSGSD